jgi:type II secretory pathway pseudopilin PulG
MNRQKNNQRGFSLLEAIIVLIAVGITAALMAAYFGANITHSAGPVNQFRASAQLNKIIETITSAYVYPYWSPSAEYIAGTIVIPTKSGRRTGLLYQAVQDGTSGPTEPDWSQAMTENSSLHDGTIVWRTVWGPGNDNGAVPVLELKQWQPNRQYLAYGIDSVVAPGDGRQYVCIAGGKSGASEWPSQGGSDAGVQWQDVGFAPALVLKEEIGAEGTQPTSFYNIDVKYKVIQNRFIKFENGTEVNIDSQRDDSEYGKYLKVVLGLHPDQKPHTDETVTALFVRQ